MLFWQKKALNKLSNLHQQIALNMLKLCAGQKGKAECRNARITHINVDETDDSKIAEIKSVLKKTTSIFPGLATTPTH